MSALNQIVAAIVQSGGGGGGTYGTLSVVQTGAEQTFTGANRTITFTNPVTAGNHIAIVVSLYEIGGDGVPSFTTSQGTPVQVFQSPMRTELSGNTRTTCYLITNASGGTGGITVSGTDPYGVCNALEINTSNGNIAVLGTANTAEGTTSMLSIAITPATASVPVLAVVGRSVLVAVSNIGIDAVTNYTNFSIEQNGAAEIGASHDRRLFTTSGSAETVSWGTLEGGTDAWTAGMVLFCAPD